MNVEFPITRYEEPTAIIEHGSKVAKALVRVVQQQRDRRLVVEITSRRTGEKSKHLRVEAWQFVGRAFGLIAGTDSLEPVLDDDKIVGWKAHAVVRSADGVVGEGFGICLKEEPRWSDRDLSQIAAMAQTRAVSRALRQCLAWVVVLAGYSPTPAEEVEYEEGGAARSKSRAAEKESRVTEEPEQG